MDYIFTKTFIIELIVTGVSWYKFQTSTILLMGIVTASKLYSSLSKKYSKNVNEQFMKAAVYDVNENFNIINLPIPKFGKNELLIHVKAGAINPVDYKVRTCNIPFYRWFVQPTVGRDFSGVIVDLGDNVRNFKIGEEVYGNALGGSLQEYTVVKPNQISHKASNISFHEAACIGLAGGTSLQALKYWGDLNNKKVLIIGASGGCGSLGVQIAKYYNARVYGVCGTKNVDFVKSIGADVVIDYTNPDYLDTINNENFDLIYDTVTSAEDPDQEVIYRKYLKINGKYVAINASKFDFFRGILCFFGINLERKDYHVTLLNWNTEDLNILKKMTEENKLNSKFTVFELNKKEIKSAFAMLQSRRVVGKLVFEI